MNNINEVFDIKTINDTKLSPVETIRVVKESISKFYDEYDTKNIIQHNFAGKVLHSYKVDINNEEYLIYAKFNIGNNCVEYHFFNLNHANQSADTLNKTNNSTQIFSYMINVIYNDISKNYNGNKVIHIIAGNRLKLYLKMVDVMIRKLDGKFYVFDIDNDSFKIATSINESISFRDYLLNS